MRLPGEEMKSVVLAARDSSDEDDRCARITNRDIPTMAHSQNFGTRVSGIPVSSGLLQSLCS